MDMREQFIGGGMKVRLYTRTGDQGQTSAIGGRLDKDDVRVEAYGTIDELNSFVGQAVLRMVPGRDDDVREMLVRIQHELFDCGSDLAFVKHGHEPYKVSKTMVEQLEREIDRLVEETPALTRFILPGGSEGAASLHVCRTVCRRAERRVVALAKLHPVNPIVLQYLNRLSDFLFAAARVVNHRAGVGDVEYVRSGNVFGRPDGDGYDHA